MEAPALHRLRCKRSFSLDFFHLPFTPAVNPDGLFARQVQHAAVWRLCVEPGKSGRCRHRGQRQFPILTSLYFPLTPPLSVRLVSPVVRAVGEHRPTPCREGDDLPPANCLRLPRTNR